MIINYFVLTVASSQTASRPQEQHSSMSSVIMYILQRIPLFRNSWKLRSPKQQAQATRVLRRDRR